MTSGPALRSMQAIGTTAVVAVTDHTAADHAARILRDELAAIDATCSRFRADSELSALHGAGGAPVGVSALLFEALAVACDVARRTGGAVDPTVGSAMEALGYDRDFGDMPGDAVGGDAPRPAPGWRHIELDPDRRAVRIPPGTRIDLGSSAKALVADRAARRIAGATRTGVLVSIGGDVAADGPAPPGGWAVGIAADSATSPDAVDHVVAIEGGGIASSSTTIRAWHRDGRAVHHIVDPATGDSAPAYWTLVSVAAASCVEANAASTAAVVWGATAVLRLEAMGHPARLVHHDGRVITVNGWPSDTARRAVKAS